MCIELHKPSAASMRELIELEREHGEQFVPSQFERGSISDVVRDGMNKANAQGFELAKIKFHQLLMAHDAKLWALLAPQIEELKP